MIIKIDNTISEALSSVDAYLRLRGVSYELLTSKDETYISLTDLPELITALRTLSGVEEILSSSSEPISPIDVEIKDVRFGRDTFTIIGGPCSIESEGTLFRTAEQLKKIGVRVLRGGAYKLRTRSDSYQGLGEKALLIMENVVSSLGMISATEVTDIRKVDLIAKHADILVVGTRNMHNYPLLKEVGRTQKPVIIKRGMCATLDEWKQAIAYIEDEGNQQIIICERGIRTYEPAYRNTLDITAIPAMHEMVPYPVIIDPSHSTGYRNYVESVSLAAVAVGAEGLMIEVDECPNEVVCDFRQTINIQLLAQMCKKIDAMLPIFKRVWSE